MQNKKSIYADHAATTPLCDVAWAAMTPFLREEFGNPYIRKGLELRSLLNGGQQEFGVRAGTENVASIVGMATVLKLNCTNIEKNTKHLDSLAARFRDGVDSFFADAVYLGSGIAEQLPGFVSVSFPGHSAEGLMHMLDLKGIAVSTGAACDSKNTKTSHVLKAINAPKAVAESTIRVSFGAENTIAEVDMVLAALKAILRRSK